MRKLILLRVAYILDGTFGVLFDGDIPFCLTLEREWRNNEKNVSCIPRSKYICKRIESPKFGDTFEVLNVSGRTDILFHKGNIEDDSHGCIIIGEQFHTYKGKISLKASREGYAEFHRILNPDDWFELEIKDGI